MQFSCKQKCCKLISDFCRLNWLTDTGISGCSRSSVGTVGYWCSCRKCHVLRPARHFRILNRSARNLHRSALVIPPQKYAESISEIRFQIRWQLTEIFAILCSPGLVFPIGRNAASTTRRVGRYFALGLPCAAFSSCCYLGKLCTPKRTVFSHFKHLTGRQQNVSLWDWVRGRKN